jgi:hypothetical protein
MCGLVKRNLYNSASKEITINTTFFMNGRRGKQNENTNKILQYKDSIYRGREVKTLGSIIKIPS